MIERGVAVQPGDPPADQPAQQASFAEAELLAGLPELGGPRLAGAPMDDPKPGIGQPGIEIRPRRTAAVHGEGSIAKIPDAVIRHVLAPVNLAAAAALSLPRGLPGAGGVALTFDDGPHPEGTPAVLEVLARAGARATFVVIGEQVRRRPELVARVAQGGHAIALHGYRHRLQLRMNAGEAAEDLARGIAAIEDAIGMAPVWHRPPYGIYSAAGLRAARDAGLRPLLWSRWGRDWRTFTTPSRIAGRATRGMIAGDVILLHDADFYSARNSHRRTVAALELITTQLAARKLGTVLPV
jgi:peptidoglycan/xylan/chitin deacetylase (PgdA/CDA1 family)